MRRRIVGYAPAALADLEWIYDTIAEASDPGIASRYDERIRSFCDSLANAARFETICVRVYASSVSRDASRSPSWWERSA